MNNVIPFIEPWRRDLPNVLNVKPEFALATKLYSRTEYNLLADIRATIGNTAYMEIREAISELLMEGKLSGYARCISDMKSEQKENTHSRPENPVSVAQ